MKTNIIIEKKKLKKVMIMFICIICIKTVFILLKKIIAF